MPDLTRSKSFSLKNTNVIRPKTVNFSPMRSKSMTSVQTATKAPSKNQLFKQQIQKYIQKRSDVEIIIHYSEYKEEFFRKSKDLQDYLYTNPEIKSKYLSDQNSHFFRGFESVLLSLFRRGVLVPGSHENMREEAVKEIERWVLSWIQRNMLYERAVDDEKEAEDDTLKVLQQIQEFGASCEQQKPLF